MLVVADGALVLADPGEHRPAEWLWKEIALATAGSQIDRRGTMAALSTDRAHLAGELAAMFPGLLSAGRCRLYGQPPASPTQGSTP